VELFRDGRKVRTVRPLGGAILRSSASSSLCSSPRSTGFSADRAAAGTGRPRAYSSVSSWMSNSTAFLSPLHREGTAHGHSGSMPGRFLPSFNRGGGLFAVLIDLDRSGLSRSPPLTSDRKVTTEESDREMHILMKSS
jgi:hypothetical protein